MKLYNKGKNKRKFKSFLSFTKKINDNIFWASIFIKRPYNIFLLTFIMFKYVKVANYIEHTCVKNVIKTL